MEYERALYRVYERCLDGFSGGPDSSATIKVFRLCQTISLVGALVFLVMLAYLHLAFVNQPSCLPALLNNAMNTTSYSLHRDHIVQLTLDKKFSPSVSTFNSDFNTNNLRSVFKPNSTHSNSTTKPDYEYTRLSAVLGLPRSLREKHNFQVINVTMTGKSCFGSELTQALLPFGGIDTAVLNAVKSTTQHSGYLKSSIDTYYHWTKEDLTAPSTVAQALLRKLGILVASCIVFFFLSTVTALLIRVLISSGVVLLFPLFWSLQCCGIHIFNSRIISLSYPWIGLPLEMIRARNQSTGPFIMGHVVRVLIFYFLYEASQVLPFSIAGFMIVDCYINVVLSPLLSWPAGAVAVCNNDDMGILHYDIYSFSVGHIILSTSFFSPLPSLPFLPILLPLWFSFVSLISTFSVAELAYDGNYAEIGVASVYAWRCID